MVRSFPPDISQMRLLPLRGPVNLRERHHLFRGLTVGNQPLVVGVARVCNPASPPNRISAISVNLAAAPKILTFGKLKRPAPAASRISRGTLGGNPPPGGLRRCGGYDDSVCCDAPLSELNWEGAIMRGPAVVRSVISFVVLGLILFGSAGALAWPQAWAFLALFILCSVGIGLWLMR